MNKECYYHSFINGCWYEFLCWQNYQRAHEASEETKHQDAVKYSGTSNWKD